MTWVAASESADYDPLLISASPAKSLDLDILDQKRDRVIPIRVYLPVSESDAPVILLSHGLGGSRGVAAFLGRHWSARGYLTIALQHPGSDESVWRGKRLGERLSAMKLAANGENLMLRIDDVHVVLNQLEKWQEEPGHPLHGRCNLSQVGMAGHSFGAVTTQNVSGQFHPLARNATDGRITAACIMSPSLPRGGNAADAFAKVKIPWLLMTGTLDHSPIGNVTAEERQKVYPLLPPGDKYELVLEGAAHAVFTDRDRVLDRSPRKTEHHQSILAISTAFWDAYLMENPSAKNWLTSYHVKETLETGDTWRWK